MFLYDLIYNWLGIPPKVIFSAGEKEYIKKMNSFTAAFNKSGGIRHV